MGSRRRHVLLTDSESEFSESDISMMEYPGRKVSHRHRSVSRHRHFSPEYSSSNAYLSPVLHSDAQQHLHRSASTGARRRSDRDRHHRDHSQHPVAVIVDVNNHNDTKSDNKTDTKTDAKTDSRNKSATKQRKAEHRLQNNYNMDYDESEDETNLRSHRRRPRSSTASISREASPRAGPAPQMMPGRDRDFELVIDQRLLERNDARQDMELFRQQQEIERLERELARHREIRQHQQEYRPHQEVRMLKEEEDWYEDEISERLRRLERFEKKQRMEEEQREVEHRYKLIKFEEAQRQAAEQEELNRKMRQKRLEDLQRKIDEEEERERIKKEIKDEEARRILAEQERARKEAAMKQAAIEEWKLAEERRMMAEREEKRRRDHDFNERLRLEFGHDERELEEMLRKKDKKEKKEEKEEKKEEEKKEKKEEKKEKEKLPEPEPPHHQRATWIKVHRKHLLPDTLIAYRLPWDWDDLDSNYIIIKQWISEDFQEELFAHTRRLREGKLVTQTSSTLTELKVNDRKKSDKMYLVRKKNPGGRAWILT